jgi:2-polyprenyl-3-methyl-5-hydroxy-6-metoxy-1,4-benzoquinol methylase
MKNEELLEELFCVKFETKALADIYFRNEAERWVHTFINERNEKEHLDRYNFVKEFTNGKKVLDIACGCGYGSYLIANEGNAKEVVAIDLDSDSIRYGNHRFNNPAIKRYIDDAQEYIKESEFDVIVSFETIEHLPKFDQFLKNMSKSLKDDGFFYVSTPIVKKTRTNCVNPFHVIEWSFEDFHKIINGNFNIEEIYLQDINCKNLKPKKTIFAKLFQSISNKINKPIIFEKYTNQIKINKISKGYQMLKCSKKI